METEKERNKKKNNTLTLVIIFITILFLGFISYSRMKEFQGGLGEIKMPRFEMPEIQLPLPGEPFKLPGMEEIKPPFDPSDMEKLVLDREIKEKFISPSGKLEIKHIEGWIKTEMPIKIPVQEINIENLLFARRFKRPFAFVTLAVQKIDFKQEMTLEKVIEKIKEETRARGIEEIEVVKLEKIKNQEARLKTIQRKKGSPITHLEKKIFLLENSKIYLITIFASEEHWSMFAEEVEKILDSTQLLK